MLGLSNFHHVMLKSFFKFQATLGAQGLCCIQVLVWKKSGNFFVLTRGNPVNFFDFVLCGV